MKRSLIKLGIIGLLTTHPTLAAPAWWSSNGAAAAPIDPAKAPNPGQVATIAQTKHFALCAINALSNAGGHFSPLVAQITNHEITAGASDKTLGEQLNISSDSSHRSPITLGQLKTISYPFYKAFNESPKFGPSWVRRQLILRGISSQIIDNELKTQSGFYYPWTSKTDDDQNNRVATHSQLKFCFCFWLGDNPDLSTNSGTTGHGDSDGIPDNIELMLGFNPNLDTSVHSQDDDATVFARLKEGAAMIGVNDYNPLATSTTSSQITPIYGTFDPPSDENIARFLSQASWGATESMIDSFKQAPLQSHPNPYLKWIDLQLEDSFPIREVTTPGQETTRLSNVPRPFPKNSRYYPGYGVDANNNPLVDNDEDRAVNAMAHSPQRLESYMYFLWSREFADRINPSKGALFNDFVNEVYSGNQPLPQDFNWRQASGGPAPAYRNWLSNNPEKYLLIDANPQDYLGSYDGTSPYYVSGFQYELFERDDAGNSDPYRMGAPASRLSIPSITTTSPKVYPSVTTPYFAGGGTDPATGNFGTAWMRQVIHGNNPLRQRMAFFLSQIFVISQQDSRVKGETMSLGKYYDILQSNAFGNYRELMEQVTYHPLMAHYLTYLYNDGAAGSPDENYAREILQLFSIGLDKMNIRGEVVGGRTYDDGNIKELAKIFTGLRLSRFGWNPGPYYGYDVWQDDLIFDPAHHNWSSKDLTFLDVPETSISPAPSNIPSHSFNPTYSFLSSGNGSYQNQSESDCVAEMDQVLDAIYNHRNVAPFVSKRLIQHFVTSNPSGDYIERVARVFTHYKHHSEQLKFVIKAVLLDPEARSWEYFLLDGNYGKLRSPILRMTQLAKALKAGKNNATNGGNFPDFDDTSYDPMEDLQWNALAFLKSTRQSPMNAPSVFNFFEPGFQLPNNPQLLAPEFQLHGPVTSLTVPNVLSKLVEGDYLKDNDSYTTQTTYEEINPPFSGLQTRRFSVQQKTTQEQEQWHIGFSPLDNMPRYKKDGDDPIGKRFVSDSLSAIKGTNPSSQPTIKQALDKLNIFFAHGRLSSNTRLNIVTALGKTLDSVATDDDLVKITQLFVATPDVAILK